jgi:AraC family transcriptional regulator
MSQNTTSGLAEQHTRRTLFQSPTISVVDFCCAAPIEPQGPEEPNPTNSIVFVRNGIFGRADGYHTLIADSNHILFFNVSQPYRFSHPVGGGDRCTILTLTTPAALEFVSRRQPRDAELTERPFPLGHGMVSRCAAVLHYELLALIKDRVSNLEIEDLLIELGDEAIRVAYETHQKSGDHSSSKSHARRRHRDLVEATKLAVNRDITSTPSLSELARSLDCSPFHLSRIFHQVAGCSIRRYVARLRAFAAAERLSAGVSDLTGLALDLGYHDHSHFTNSFRREWGVPPRVFREHHLSAG